MEWLAHRKKVIWVVVTILLGAVGSGLWEFALKPCLSWFATSCINGVISISSDFSIAIYSDIARGYNYRIEKMILGWTTGGVLGLWIVIAINPWIRVGSRTESVTNWKSHALSLIAVFICSIILFLTSLTLFMTNRINNFEQILCISAPYLNEIQVKQAKSDFGQIRTKDDYDRLMKRLRAVAYSSGAYLPTHLK